MEDVSHHEHVGFRQLVREEVAGGEPEPFLHAVVFDVVLEDRRHLGQVEADAREVLVRERDLHREVALGRPDVDERLVLVPRELPLRSPGWRRD